MKSGIYQLKFRDGSTYIGKSKDIDRRMLEHKKALETGKAASKLQRAYILSGYPTYEVLLLCHRDHLELLEAACISRIQPDLNTTLAVYLSEEDIERLVQGLPLLQHSTSTLIALLIDTQNRVDDLEETVESMTDDIDLLEEKRSAEELETELGRKLNEEIELTTKLRKELEDLEAKCDALIEDSKKPWWKKVFGK